MHWKAIATTLVAAFVACSCSAAPSPTNPPTATPTALVCPGPHPGDPGFADQSQNRMVNGSFGDPAIRGKRRVTSLSGWTVTGTVDLVAATSCLPFPDNQYASLSFGAALTQTVATVPGTAYELSASDSREGVCSTAASEFDIDWNSEKVSSDLSSAEGTTPTGGSPPSPWGFVISAGAEVGATSALSEVRFVVADAAESCRFDVSNISLVVKPKTTPAP